MGLAALVARMSIPQHNRPVLELHLARPPLDPRRLSGKGMPARFGSSIDVGSCVERVVQQGEDAPTPQWFPDQFPFLRSFPESIIVVSRIIDALFVNDQRVGEGTNLQEVIPIAARARQA